MFGISDSIKKMAFSQFKDFMQKKNVSECVIYQGENGELEIKTIEKPHVFIGTDQHEKIIADYKAEFQRLRQQIVSLQEEINTLKK